MNKITAIRNKELRHLTNSMYLGAAVSFTFICAPFLVRNYLKVPTNAAASLIAKTLLSKIVFFFFGPRTGKHFLRKRAVSKKSRNIFFFASREQKWKQCFLNSFNS